MIDLTHHWRDKSGFTLLELMVTLVIMTIVIALAINSFTYNPSEHLEEEASRIALIIEHANNQAHLASETLSLSFKEDQYEFWQLDDQGSWLPVFDDPVLRARKLPEGVSVGPLIINNQTVQEGTKLVFPPTGNSITFTIPLYTEGKNDGYWLISGDILGRISISNDSVLPPPKIDWAR